MGSWGTYPKDSDGALDLFGDIGKVVNKQFDTLAKGYSGYDYAGAVMILLQSGFHLDKKIVKQARDFVKKEIENTEKGKSSVSWKDIQTAIKDMSQVLKGFDELLSKSNKNEKHIIAPLHWLERKGDRIKTNWSGLGFV